MRHSLLTFGLALVMGMPVAQASFTDVLSLYPYFDAIQYVESKGIVSGYPDNTFQPKANINRAEFLAILVRAKFSGQASGSNCFPDVQQEWFATFVCFAKEQGIISGYPDGTFKPANTVSYAEAAKILAGIYAISKPTTSEPWYASSVSYLEQCYAVPISIDDYSSPITRGEMAEMIYRLQENITDKQTKIGRHYVKDKQAVFFKEYSSSESRELKGADPATFTVLFQDDMKLFARDKAHIYQGYSILEGIDSQSFRARPYNNGYVDYFSDRDKIYSYDYPGELVPLAVADVGSFEVRDGFAIDKNAVYVHNFYTEPVKQADRDSFRHLDGHLYRDKDHVFYEGTLIEGADPETAKFIRNMEYGTEHDYAVWKDRNYAYHGRTRIIGADAASFELINADEGLFRDIDGFFTIDIKTFPSTTPKRSDFKDFDAGTFHTLDLSSDVFVDRDGYFTINWRSPTPVRISLLPLEQLHIGQKIGNATVTAIALSRKEKDQQIVFTVTPPVSIQAVQLHSFETTPLYKERIELTGYFDLPVVRTAYPEEKQNPDYFLTHTNNATRKSTIQIANSEVLATILNATPNRVLHVYEYSLKGYLFSPYATVR